MFCIFPAIFLTCGTFPLKATEKGLRHFSFSDVFRTFQNLGACLPSENFTSHKWAIFNPFNLARFQDMLQKTNQNKKVTWRCEHNSNSQFFYLTKRKKISMLWTTETTILFFDHSKMIETCYEDTTQTTTFWILAETFYIPFTFCNFSNQLIGWKWKF